MHIATPIIHVRRSIFHDVGGTLPLQHTDLHPPRLKHVFQGGDIAPSPWHRLQHFTLPSEPAAEPPMQKRARFQQCVFYGLLLSQQGRGTCFRESVPQLFLQALPFCLGLLCDTVRLLEEGFNAQQVLEKFLAGGGGGGGGGSNNSKQTTSTTTTPEQSTMSAKNLGREPCSCPRTSVDKRSPSRAEPKTPSKPDFASILGVYTDWSMSIATGSSTGAKVRRRSISMSKRAKLTWRRGSTVSC